METIKELATGRSKQADVYGTSFTAYPLTPVLFLKEVVDAAKKRYFFTNIAYITKLGPGQKDVVIPVRDVYLGDSGFTWQTTEPSAGTALTSTKIDNLDGVTLTPALQGARVSISNHALRTHALDLIKAAKEELVYAIGDKVDIAVATATKASANQSSSSARGAQIVYGGDARRDSELAAGDTITTDMVAEGKRKLQSTTCMYWPATAGSEAESSQAKNPWQNMSDFVLHIAAEEEEVFLKDSQFINAAEYGSNEIVLNGEIGKYLGVKIVITPNTPSYATGDDSPDGESSGNPGVAMHRCILVKGQKAVALAWGMDPAIKLFDNVIEISQEIVLETAYQAKVLHKDAIVFLDVAKS